jgi:hypothetical protein
MFSRSNLAVLVAAASLATVSHAGGFRIDEAGSKPRSFRITALKKGIHSGFSADIFETSLFNRSGKSIKSSPGYLRLGLQGEKVVMVMETGWQNQEYKVIGDATELDHIRLSPGVSFEGHKVWDMASRVWRTRSNSEEWTNLPVFEGQFLDQAWARDRLLETLASGKQESKGNLAVLRSVLTQSWWDILDDENSGGNSGGQSADFYFERTQAFYMNPMRAAYQAADAKGRKRLASFHAEMEKGAKERQDYYRKDDWRPEVYMQTFDRVRADLAAMSQEFSAK